MKKLRRLLVHVANFTARRDDQRPREEMEEHLAPQTTENLRVGMFPGEARRQAVLKFGAVEAVRGEYHAGQRLPLLEELVTSSVASSPKVHIGTSSMTVIIDAVLSN